MLINLAVLSSYHTLRVNGWIGNFATLIENAFFGSEPLTAKMPKQYGHGGKIDGLRAEDYIRRIGE
jgi:hypothetical protein